MLSRKKEIQFASLFLFIGIAEFMILVFIAGFIFPGYSVSNNYISDLGNYRMHLPSAYIFNTSIILLGIFIILCGYFLRKFYFALSIVFVLAGIGAMGVGAFPEYYFVPHTIFAFLAFLMISIAPFFILMKIRNISTLIWVVLGLIGLVALILYGSGHFLGLGHGGMERLIVYPNFIWALFFAGYLSGNLAQDEIIGAPKSKSTS